MVTPSYRGQTVLTVLALILVGCVALSSAQKCPVQHKASSLPLLFGGLHQKGACQGKNCKPRNTPWAQICSFNPASLKPPGACTTQQRAQAWPYIRAFDNGGATRLKPCDLWPYIRGRTVWIIGDSFGKNFYKALQCFFIDFWNHKQCQANTDSNMVNALKQLKVQAGESKCIHLYGLTRICMVVTALGSQFTSDPSVPNGGVLPFLQNRWGTPNDIFIVNFGIWDRKQGEPGYANYAEALRDLNNFYQRTRGKFPHLIWKETPADHPKDMNRGVCLPIPGLTGRGFGSQISQRRATPSTSSAMPAGRLNAVERQILGIPRFGRAGYELSLSMHHQHWGMRGVPVLDCLHYCHLGMPEVWVYELYQALRSGTAGVKPLPAKKLGHTHKCVPYNGP